MKNWDRIQEKLNILADAAKYDVSCSSSGSKRGNKGKMLGDTTASGICHTYTKDGRCVSLLKILLTNHCIFDCKYCVSRRSNDIKRAGFTVEEVVDLTMNFYRRNYIEGLFLSSGIFKSADFTMERLVRVAKTLRTEHRFNGYIHLKTIPGASPELLKEAGLWADRLSINIELPTEEGLKLLAPEKNRKDMDLPMEFLKDTIQGYKEEKKVIKSSPRFAPAGQSSQMIIGATNETDLQIVRTATELYSRFDLKRVYYSGYVPVLEDSALPSLETKVPMLRENRLYQTDWLMRFYGFAPSEILSEAHPNLDLQVDPKLSWALRNMHMFPVDVNQADRGMLLRIPGLGIRSVNKILAARKFAPVRWATLIKLGVALNRAKYFLTCPDHLPLIEKAPSTIRHEILSGSKSKALDVITPQLSLF